MKRKIFLLSLALVCCAVSICAKTYMVSVGVADYPGTKNDLRLSGQDAVTMKELYEKNGNADVVILLNENAKLEEVAMQMKIQFGKASDDDTIILFFSGHGVSGGFVCYNQVMYFNTIYKIMASSRAKHKMVFADTCYSGKARKAGKKQGRIKKDSEIMFFLSSRANEKSMENEKWKNGFFTAYLERGLRGGADINFDHTITAYELFKFVSDGVKDVSQDRQHPVMWGSFDHDMPVMTWK